MIGAGSFEYALPRMHGRLAKRPGQAAWSAIEQARDINPIVAVLRETSLEAMAGLLTPAPDLHSIDHAARHAWSRTVADAASWMPPAWSSAVSWCALLPRLPALAHLARGGKPAAWMRADPVIAAACHSPAGDDKAGSVLAPLLRSAADPLRLADLWCSHWNALRPRNAADPGPLDALVHLFVRHTTRFREALPHEASQLRRQLETRLIAAFRRHPFDAAAMFAWLGIMALDLERARGELARRVAFPDAVITA